MRVNGTWHGFPRSIWYVLLCVIGGCAAWYCSRSNRPLDEVDLDACDRLAARAAVAVVDLDRLAEAAEALKRIQTSEATASPLIRGPFMVENARGVRRERIVFRCGQASLSVGATNGVVREVTLTAIGRSQANGIPLRRTFVVGSGASAAAILECGPHIFELARDADGSVVVEAWINDAIDGGVFFVGTKDGIVAEARRM